MYRVMTIQTLRFQLTTSRRGRRRQAEIAEKHFHISTHDLTKRSTLLIAKRFVLAFEISTHDLTKRSTTVQGLSTGNGSHFNSRPHEEVDSEFFRNVIFFHKFQLTTSRRGRQLNSFMLSLLIILSTHDLTKRSTSNQLAALRNLLIFQLTTSRRGRPQQITESSAVLYFNSRPHEEVDYIGIPLSTVYLSISTHDLTKRSTWF